MKGVDGVWAAGEGLVKAVESFLEDDGGLQVRVKSRWTVI